MKEKTLKFKMTITSVGKRIATVNGINVPDRFISIEDLRKIVPTEQYLERLFGLRFHIDVDDNNIIEV